MDNYLFNDKLIAIKKENNKTIIYNVDNSVVINNFINNIIEFNCCYYGSTLDGRKKSANILLNIKYKTPIYINDYITLIPIYSIRNNESLYIVASKILNYIKKEDKLLVNCCNNHDFLLNISIYAFEKNILNAFRLNNTLKYHKNI